VTFSRSSDAASSPMKTLAADTRAGHVAIGRARSGGSDRNRDRLHLAVVSGTIARHVTLSGTYPYGEDAAIAEVRAAARGRADLLAELADTYLGISVTHPVDQTAAQLVRQANLADRAGANIDEVGRWIPVGLKRGEDILASRQPRL
jgi:hypothetical protein